MCAQEPGTIGTGSANNASPGSCLCCSVLAGAPRRIFRKRNSSRRRGAAAVKRPDGRSSARAMLFDEESARRERERLTAPLRRLIRRGSAVKERTGRGNVARDFGVYAAAFSPARKFGIPPVMRRLSREDARRIELKSSARRTNSAEESRDSALNLALRLI